MLEGGTWMWLFSTAAEQAGHGLGLKWQME
jgi:hypothetical protein